MLVVYESSGRIQQIVSHGAFDLLKVKYEEIGLGVLMTGDTFDPTASYVFRGRVVPMPAAQMYAPDTQVAADGVSEVLIRVAPASARAVIIFQGQRIAEATVTDGIIHFSTTHAGLYEVGVIPEFPYLPASVHIGAV